MSWTVEREKKLKELWKKGHTASQIAEILGDTTRNAVIGVLRAFSLRGASRLHLEKHIVLNSPQEQLQLRNSLEV